MPVVTNLSRSLVVDAVSAENLRYTIDDDGDVHVILSRRKGKDLDVFVFGATANKGVLSFACFVKRWFPRSKMPELMFHCNEWNKTRRMPKAYVSGPDKDDDFSVGLDYSVFCERGIHRNLIQETVTSFCGGAIQFWDDLDERM